MLDEIIFFLNFYLPVDQTFKIFKPSLDWQLHSYSTLGCVYSCARVQYYRFFISCLFTRRKKKSEKSSKNCRSYFTFSLLITIMSVHVKYRNILFKIYHSIWASFLRHIIFKNDIEAGIDQSKFDCDSPNNKWFTGTISRQKN